MTQQARFSLTCWLENTHIYVLRVEFKGLELKQLLVDLQ